MPRAVEQAEARGHVVYDDPPWGLSSAMRWTCSRCEAAVLSYNGNIYGSAVETDCQVTP